MKGMGARGGGVGRVMRRGGKKRGRWKKQKIKADVSQEKASEGKP